MGLPAVWSSSFKSLFFGVGFLCLSQNLSANQVFPSLKFCATPPPAAQIMDGAVPLPGMTPKGGTNSFVASFLSRLAAWSPTDVLFGFILIACLKNSSYPPTLQQYSEWQATVIVLELFVLTVQLSWKTRGQGSSPFLLFPLRLVCTTRKSHFQLALIFESHVSRGGEKKKESHMEDTNTFPPMLDPLLPTRGVSHAALE